MNKEENCEGLLRSTGVLASSFIFVSRQNEQFAVNERLNERTSVSFFIIASILGSEKSDSEHSERSSATPPKNKKSLIDDSSEDEVRTSCFILIAMKLSCCPNARLRD